MAIDISDTFWITGNGLFDPDGSGPLLSYQRLYLLDAISIFGTPGDANRDGSVDFNDLLIIAQNYGATSGAVWDTGDFNDDDEVNFADLLTLSQHYGESGLTTLPESFDSDFVHDWTYASSLVPEPASLTLLAFGALLLRRRH